MTIDDLKLIFKDQLETGDELSYMMIEGDYKIIERCFSENIELLLPCLDNFEYIGNTSIPRFSKL